jgi:hypothetical protein
MSGLDVRWMAKTTGTKGLASVRISFKRALLSLFACGAMALSFAPSVAAEGICLSPTGGGGQLIVIKHYTDTVWETRLFDYADGAVTVRDLDNCTGPSGSAILPANIQTTAGIYQLGYEEKTTSGIRCFTYVFQPNGGTPNGTCTGPTPVVGRSYVFLVSLIDLANGTMNVHYKIIDKTSSPDVVKVDFTKNTTNRLKGFLVWWGAEKQHNEDSIGNSHDATTANINMRLMHYSVDGDGGTLTQRSGLTNNVCTKYFECMPGSDFFRTENMAGAPAIIEQHYHIGTDNVSNDQVDFDNTAN